MNGVFYERAKKESLDFNRLVTFGIFLPLARDNQRQAWEDPKWISSNLQLF